LHVSKEDNNALQLHLLDALQFKVKTFMIFCLTLGTVNELHHLVDPEGYAQEERVLVWVLQDVQHLLLPFGLAILLHDSHLLALGHLGLRESKLRLVEGLLN